MCLAVPMKIVKIEGSEAIAEFNNIKRRARLDLVEDCKIGDYVLIHAGFVIEKLDEQAARDSLEAWDEILRTLQEEY